MLMIEKYLIELRRYFHENPELSNEEYNTARKIEEELEKLGISHKRVNETGVVGYIENIYNKDKAKNIVLRADIDALPIQELNEVSYKSKNEKVMHACGHDAHIAMLLGAARVLKENINSLNGKVTFIFQMAEEIGGGAKHFIKAGYLEDADRVIGLHMASFYKTGTIAFRSGESGASCDYFKITVKGKSAHISKPQDGIDSLYIASKIVCAIKGIISNNVDPLENALIGIGKMYSGTNYNIVAQEAVLEGTTRAFNEKTRNFINQKIESISKGIAESFGAEVIFELKDFASPLINDEDAYNEFKEAAIQTVTNKNVVNASKNLMADDFAEYSKKTKGLFAFIGSSKGKDTSYAHHNERFDIDEESLLVGTNVFVNYVKNLIGSD